MPRGHMPMLSGACKLPLLYVLASFTLITASPYWAKAVLIPVALALLLAFLLNPVVHAVQRLGIGRVPVVVQAHSALWQLPTLLESLATAALVLVLVIFMLLERGDLRNRLIRLVGYGRLTLTTKALDEAGQRISRYLLM